jgi:acetyl esterase/lipase
MKEKNFCLFCLAALLSFPSSSFAQESTVVESSSGVKRPPSYDASVPAPTLSEIPYGKHPRQVLDYWRAPSTDPTPLIFVIHGGGWKAGSKERLHKFVDTAALLEAGISVAAINYRLISQAGDFEPPVKAPLSDAARALQFVRSKADEWNIDRNRIGGAGGSAGACSSLWLAYHDDMADPESAEPVARESTRLFCVAARGAQTTLDPKQMKEWTPNSRYGAHAFGLESFHEFLAERENILPWIAAYSPYALVSPDDPPAFLSYSDVPAKGVAKKDPTHTANFGAILQEKCKANGVVCILNYPGSPDRSFEDATDFLIEVLKGGNVSPADCGSPTLAVD